MQFELIWRCKWAAEAPAQYLCVRQEQAMEEAMAHVKLKERPRGCCCGHAAAAAAAAAAQHRRVKQGRAIEDAMAHVKQERRSQKQLASQ